MPDVSTVAPDLSGLTQPAPAAAVMPAPNQAAPPPEAMTPGMAPPDVTDRSINPAKPPTPPPGAGAPPPHARLLAMVQGLSIGLSAAATSIATHGREGGAQEVIQIQQGQQAAQREQQAFATAQKNAQLQQQLTTAETNRVNGQNLLLFGTLHDEQQQSHFKTQQAGLETQEKAQQMFDTTGQVPQGYDVDPQTGQVREAGKATQAPAPTPGNASTPNVLPGVTPGAPAPAAVASTGPSIFDRRQGMILDAAGQKLGEKDPDVAAAKAVVADPRSTPQQKKQAVIMIQNKAGLREDVVKDLTAKADLQAKQEAAIAATPVAKLSTPEALAAPGAQAAIQSKIDDPNTDPKDIARLRALLPQAAVAQLNAENIKAREARNTQIVNQGSPDDAGRLLANKSLTLEELKSRQVTPAFIDAAVLAAQKYDPTFKAPEAAAQSRIAASPANSQFFGNTDSLLVRGGTLDQLEKAHAALGNTKLPFANKLENWSKAAVGSGPQAAFAASALGVADDYSKVISGGAGSDSSRQQALNIIGRDLSPEGMAASLAQIRSTITSQRNGRISTNPYLQSMYPDPTTRQETPGVAGTQPAAKYTRPAGVSAGAKLMQAPGGQPHWIEPANLPAAQKLGATEVQ